MRVLQAYRFALDPTPRQQRALASHVGARRFAFNWGLALVKERLEARARGEDVEVPWTLPDLRREWNRQKHLIAPWWRENSKEAYSSGLNGLARALQNWSKSHKGQRKGRRVGFPRFRKKGRGRESVRFTTGAIRVDDKSHVVLPRIGRVKTHEPTTALLRRIQTGTARILSATVTREGGRWFVSFTCEVERQTGRPRFPWRVVGVDAGVKHLAVLSTGEVCPNPRALEKNLKQLARWNRALARRQKGSRGWQKARRRLARLHGRVRNIRQDALHKLTHHLASTYGVVVVEQLNAAGMLKNRRLARALADAALAEIRRQLRYKCPWHGAVLVEAPPFYPSSKRCSRCGAVKPSLPLSQRVFRCEECGLVLDRDENAARNLATLVAAVAGSGPETLNARGRDGRPALRQAVPEEAGSRRRLIAG
ncbi:IS607 family element RNA-guided endonuclease TnpB [Thermaerobacter composti]|uniref:IS607 family element RNA-guided endonuclease TnpB n=1 Tax=Thermaerobacter composti TaxID=554949 RepID=A0ABZ0QPJ9_9FIRM|nr:IS607 family element RNA-guided endonuclease TnpB [Thermaerobacter composti]WPD18938.1 IS607 family element RNA-guided endonuclease TnpB [Thermaerobacter composti]